MTGTVVELEPEASILVSERTLMVDNLFGAATMFVMGPNWAAFELIEANRGRRSLRTTASARNRGRALHLQRQLRSGVGLEAPHLRGLILARVRDFTSDHREVEPAVGVWPIEEMAQRVAIRPRQSGAIPEPWTLVELLLAAGWERLVPSVTPGGVADLRRELRLHAVVCHLAELMTVAAIEWCYRWFESELVLRVVTQELAIYTRELAELLGEGLQLDMDLARRPEASGSTALPSGSTPSAHD